VVLIVAAPRLFSIFNCFDFLRCLFAVLFSILFYPISDFETQCLDVLQHSIHNEDMDGAYSNWV
jgi:hypothetical protein